MTEVEETVGEDTQEAVRGENEQGPAATPSDAPEDGTADLTQASEDAGKEQGTIDDELVPEENLDPDGRDGEADVYPNYYMEGEGHVLLYPGDKFAVDACVVCGHRHATGQFTECEECGADLTERRGVMVDGEIVDPSGLAGVG